MILWSKLNQGKTMNQDQTKMTKNLPLEFKNEDCSSFQGQLFPEDAIAQSRSYGPIDSYESDEDPYQPICVYGLPAA